MAKYKLRFGFWSSDRRGDTCLESVNRETEQVFGLYVKLVRLPLSRTLLYRAFAVTNWYQTFFDWDNSPEMSRWWISEREQFRSASKELLILMQQELGEGYELVDSIDFALEQLETYYIKPNELSKQTEAIYRLRYFWDWGSQTCFWSGNNAAKERFEYEVDVDNLPLPELIKRRIYFLASWHNSLMDWANAPEDSIWGSAESERFGAASSELLTLVRQHLGSSYEVVVD